ncbi:MAG: hypothetical protein WD872_09865 [Pirellulaceae bacterium]
MMARWFVGFLAFASLAGSGCCCLGPQPGCNTCGPGGPAGGPSAQGVNCFCLPKPIVWCGESNECGPGGCGSCAGPTDCGILPALMRARTCGKGCGEIYWGEWISDPPDCCDPCDPCHGQFTGPHGYCSLGPCQRLLAALHGFRYCPKPCGFESCGPLCNKPACNAGHACGDVGCSTCGGGEHVAGHMPGEVYYEGAAPGHGHSHGQSILNENWDRPAGPKPIPGKPIHKAQQPRPLKVGAAQPPAYGRMVKTAGYWGR